MSFGKRQESKIRQAPAAPKLPDKSVRPISNGASDGAPRREPRTSSCRKPARVFAGFAVGLALIAVTTVTIKARLRNFEHELDQSFENVVTDGTYAKQVYALLKTKTANDVSFGSCTMKRTQTLAEQYSREGKSDPGRDSMMDDLKQHLGGEESAPLLNGAEFLDCVATEEGQRLCKPENRAAFATDIAYFYREYDLIAGLTGFGSTTSDPKFAELMQKFDEAQPEIANLRGDVNAEFANARQTVDGALQHALALGLVSKSDFGFFPHKAIKQIAAETKVTSQFCK